MTDPYRPQPEGTEPNQSIPPIPLAPPTYAPPSYVPPAYPASPYGAAPQPVQPTPGAAPVMPAGYGAYAPAPKTNGLAIASMVLSILGFLWILPLVGSIAGTIMGHASLGQIKRTGDSGRGLALAGVIVGWAGIGVIILAVLFFVFVIALSASASRYGG